MKIKFSQLILESNSLVLYHRSEHEFKDGVSIWKVLNNIDENLRQLKFIREN